MRGTIICGILLCTICFYGALSQKVIVGNIETLTATTIYKYLQDASSPVFIQFYAGDCNYCKALAPLWAQLSRERTEEYIAVVDCITEEVLCAAWDINSVPAMFLYRDGNLYPYDGTRELEDLHEFLDVNSKNVAPVALPDEIVLRKALFRQALSKHGQGVTISIAIFGLLLLVGLVVCLGYCCTPSIDNETITNEKPEAKKPAANKKAAEVIPKKEENPASSEGARKRNKNKENKT